MILVIINKNFKNPFSRILIANCSQSFTEIVFASLFAASRRGRSLINEKKLVGSSREAEKPTPLPLSAEEEDGGKGRNSAVEPRVRHNGTEGRTDRQARLGRLAVFAFGNNY